MMHRIIILFTFIFSMSSLSACNINQTFELLSILNSLLYEYRGPYSSGHLPITEDIQINGTVVITSQQLKVPGECLERKDCRHYFGFQNLYEAGGVSTIPETKYPVYLPGTLILTNVKVRFRKLLIDTHPWIFNF